ncbi:Rieske (2Fe-2S) protein [Streptomyces sp. GSL17-111]|uniref:Rieske (2Fe-2S) protein n=1 Tax=Streptomyces sp. GSL17-111 TaxID=3121596 RepID=UPI0030F3FE3F
MRTPETSRRAVLAAAGAAGFTTVLVACGGTDSAEPDTGGTRGGSPEEGSTGSAPEGGGGGEELAKTSDIPEGGGRVFADQKVVVAQPVAGEFTAYSAVCTHQNCLVKEVADGTINCVCHGSRFAVEDGAVVDGPAQRPLPPAEITVSGDTILLG